MKRSISIFVCVSLLIPLLCRLPVGASAASAPVLRLEQEYDPQQSCIARVSAYLDHCSGLYAGALELQWTGDDLRYIKGAVGVDGAAAAIDIVGNTVGFSLAYEDVCREESIELFTVSFGVKRACATEFRLAVSDRQLYGVKIPRSVSLSAEFAQPVGGLPYYITTVKNDGTLRLDGALIDRSHLEVPARIGERNVTEIGVGAFRDIKELKELVLPAGIESIGANAFAGCEWLKKVTFPVGLTSVGAFAFADCRSLDGVEFPASVTFLGSGAFRGCSSLSKIALPEGLSYLGDKVFMGCASLSDAVFAGSDQISVGLFKNCTALKQIAIPANVTSIGESAFENCRSLPKIALPEGTVDIGDRAFADCASLKRIDIPANVESIGLNAFAGCSSLENIYVSPRSLRYADDEGAALYTADRRELIFFAPGALLTEYTAVASTEMIDADAFADVRTLQKLSLPAGIVDIGADAFLGCSALREIAVAEGGAHCYVKDGALYLAFNDPSGGRRVTLVCLPAACGIETFTVAADVTAIAPHALTGVGSVKAYEVDPQNSSFRADDAGALYNYEKTELIAYPPASDAAEFDLPGGVREVRADAFAGSRHLTAIDSKSMYHKDVDGVLFSGDKLTLTAYPGGRTAEEYVVPAQTEYIADGAFVDVSAVSRLTLPSTLVSVGEGSFCGASFGAVAYDGTRGEWEDVAVGRRNGDALSQIVFTVADEEPADLVPAAPGPEETTTSPAEPGNDLQTGDVDGNGKVNSADARLALRAAAKVETLSELAARLADVDGNGKIQASDARTILRVAAKLERFPDAA